MDPGLGADGGAEIVVGALQAPPGGLLASDAARLVVSDDETRG